MKWIKRLLSKGQRPAAPVRPREVVISSNEEVPNSLRHLVKGYRLCVTMNLSTPFEWLQRHGELADKPGNVPMQYGVWSPELKTFEELGIPGPDLTPTTMASVFGYIPASGGEALDFLKKYRTVVEGPASESEKRRDLSALGAEYPDLARKVSHDLAEFYFVGELREQLGCGPATAQKLYFADLSTPDKVRSASLQELYSIKGIGKVKAQSLKSAQ